MLQTVPSIASICLIHGGLNTEQKDKVKENIMLTSKDVHRQSSLWAMLADAQKSG